MTPKTQLTWILKGVKMIEVKRVKLEIKKGLIIRDPIKKMVHKGEVVVKLDTFWRRRIKDGDVKMIEEVKTDKPKSETSNKKEHSFSKSSKKTNKSGGN